MCRQWCVLVCQGLTKYFLSPRCIKPSRPCCHLQQLLVGRRSCQVILSNCHPHIPGENKTRRRLLCKRLETYHQQSSEIFLAFSLAMAFRDKFHETWHIVTAPLITSNPVFVLLSIDVWILKCFLMYPSFNTGCWVYCWILVHLRNTLAGQGEIRGHLCF